MVKNFRLKKEKRGLETSFTWLFALFVGAVILSLAIFTVVKIKSGGEMETSFKVSTQLYVLTNPLETGIESGSKVPLEITKETRITNLCNDFGEFGNQKLGISQETFGKWNELENNLPSTPNKYFLSEATIQGKKFILFSKPFESPFKVADLIYLIPEQEKFCFINSPYNVQTELKNIDSEMFFFGNNCTEGMKKVCFDSSNGCDVVVRKGQGFVEKGDDRMFFSEDAMMYGAIFSDKEVYECQTKRLMKRLEKLTKIYVDKSSIVAQEGCNTNADQDLLLINNFARNLDESRDLVQLGKLVEEARKKNVGCMLW